METRQSLLELFVQILLCAAIADGSALGTSPKFIDQPTNNTVQVTGSASISCSALGSPQPSIAWFKDGVRIVPDSRVTLNSLGHLQIVRVESADVGSYQCEASNTVGSVRSYTARLSLAFIDQLPPASLQGVQHTNYNSVTLSCSLPSSLPNPAAVTWTPPLSNNQLASGRVGVASSGQLVFSYFDSLTDVGIIYTCIVTNQVTGHSQTSSSYLLTRSSNTAQLFHAVQISIPPTPSQTVVAGETLHLECFTVGRPVATVSWLKDGATLSSNSRISITQSGRSLDISSVIASDEGTYTCVAEQQTNDQPIVIRSTGEVTVIVPPSITTYFPETAANISQALSLTCTASEGTLPLEWAWYFNSDRIMTSPGVTSYGTTGRTTTLTINEVRAEHGGVYQCVVTQPSTGYESNVNDLVTAVSVSPSFTHGQGLADQLVLEDSAAVFPCTATGFPPPQFVWMRPGSSQPININSLDLYSISDQPGNGTLTISNAAPGDTSLLFCRASNDGGSITSNTVQLRVLSTPAITLSPPSASQPDPGQTLTLQCRVTTSPDVVVTYQWSKETEVLSVATSGSLTLSDIDVNHNGAYGCTALLSVNGVSVPPLPFFVGTSVVTVGAPPEPPSPPLDINAMSISATSFIASWSPSASTGGLPLRNFSIEIQTLGNELCTGDFNWRTVQAGVRPNQTSAMITGLIPDAKYKFRVMTFNYAFQSPYSATMQLRTLESVPQAPPTILQATETDEQGEIRISWQAPPNCLHGGQLTGFTVEYRVQQPQGVWQHQTIAGADSTQVTLTRLNPETEYEIRVAAGTSSGLGEFSGIARASTRQAQLVAPSAFAVRVINSTSVMLSWEHPHSQTTHQIMSYRVVYVHPDGRQIETSVEGKVTSTVIGGLFPGESYMFQVSAVYTHSESLPATSDDILLIAAEKPFYKEVWFIVAIAVSGVLLISFLMVVTTVICFKCCYKCGSENGKIYFSSRRSASSLSGGSSGFSEFQHKHKVMSRIVKVSSSPAPSRRSTDYADMDSLRAAPSTTATSQGYQESIASEHTNGRASGHRGHMMRNGGHMTHHQGFIDDPNDQLLTYPHQDPDYPIQTHRHFESSEKFDLNFNEPHIRHMICGTSQQFVDTLNRVHTPPIPRDSESPDRSFPYHSGTPPNRYLSQEIDENWNPADNLNPRGHRTNNIVSRSNSGCSSKTGGSHAHMSSACSTPQKMDPGGNRRRQGPLSPVHEQHLTNGVMSHDNHMISDQGMSMQFLPQRANTVSHMSQSTGHIARDHRHMSAGGLAQSKYLREPPVGMELGVLSKRDIQQRELPALPKATGRDRQGTAGSPPPGQHSIEYSTIPVHLSHSEPLNQPDSLTHYPPNVAQRPINYYLPPPPEGDFNGFHEQSSSPDHPYPPHKAQITYNQTKLCQIDINSYTRQLSSPSLTNYPLHTRQPPPSDYPPPLTHTRQPPPPDCPPPLTHTRQPPPSDYPPSPTHTRQPPPSNYPPPLTHTRQPPPPLTQTRQPPPSDYPPSPTHTRQPPPSDYPPPLTHTRQPPPSDYPPPSTHVRQLSSPPPSNHPPPTTHTRQLSSPPNTNHLQPHIHTRQPPPSNHPPPHTHARQLTPSKHPPPHTHAREVSAPVYSAPVVKPKPKIKRNVQNDISRAPDSQSNVPQSTQNGGGWVEHTPLQNRSQAVSHSDQKLLDTTVSEDSWPLSDIQRQFETDIQDLEEMQRTLYPVVSDSTLALEDQVQTVAMNDGAPVLSRDVNPRKAPLNQIVMNQHPEMDVPPQDYTHSNGTKLSASSIALSTSQNSPNRWPGEDSNSLAINKQRPSVPDLSQLKLLDPRTPRIKQGKVPGAIWQPRSMNKAIESSSESDSDSDFSIADTVIEPGDNTSLKSSHV